MDNYPKNYQLTFEPDFKKFVFSGHEIVTVVCKKPTSQIVMDCAEIKIKSIQVNFQESKINSSFKIDEKNETLSIKLAKKIKGEISIEMSFQGTLNDRLLGFYRSQYKQGNTTKYLATTQFEAADARRAFPCWDQPSAKATFEISIIAENKFSAISNMPVQSKKKLKNKTLYKFAKTPIMSTYLIYLGV